MWISALFAAAVLSQTQVSPPAAVSGPLPILPFPSGTVQTVNIIQWDANQLPRIFQRSEQLPLTDEEVAKLSKAGFDTASLVKMIEERRCACDASADGLIKLKQQGVAKEVLSAISLHGLKPNRALWFEVMLDFSGDGNQARETFLYFFIDDGPVTRVFSASIADVLAGRHRYEETVDRSDLLIARRVRRVRLPGEIALTTYGKHTLMVAASANPTLSHPSMLTAAERQSAQIYTFDYPRVSLQNVCRLHAGYRRDPVLTYRWKLVGSRFECEWN